MFWDFDHEEIVFGLKQYGNGATAVQAWSIENGPYATISVNLEDAPVLPKGQFYLKHWSENTQIAIAMIRSEIIERVEGAPAIRQGFCETQAYQFTEKGKQYLD